MIKEITDITKYTYAGVHNSLRPVIEYYIYRRHFIHYRTHTIEKKHTILFICISNEYLHVLTCDVGNMRLLILKYPILLLLLFFPHLF